MDIKEILSHLERNEGYFPRAAVQEAIDHRDEMIPALLGVLEDVDRNPRPFASPNRFIHIYAMYLLAQFRDTRAYPLLVKIFSAPGELPFQLAGDVVTEDLVLGDEIGRYFKHHQRNDLGSADVTRTYGTKY